MSNTFQTAEQMASVAAAIAAKDLGLAQHVYRDVAADFRPGGGTTVNVPVPGVTTTSTRPVGSTADYALGQITETTIPVTLTTEAYSVVPVTLDESTLDVSNYSRQVLRPQALTVANHVNSAVASALAGATPDATITYDPANPRSAFIRARAILRGRGVPAETPIKAVVGSNVFADVLLAEALDDQGRVGGIPVHENTRVDADALYVFVTTAFVAAIRAPQAPDDAVFSASVTVDDMALTLIKAFNPANGLTNSIVTAFIGVAPMPLPVADYDTGTVDLVDGGGIVSITTV
ncbi:P22 phage major capsid protein family protein [Isoptericola sp. b490]|uniref:P22 phage major capsid protein family protein n=1 Tax=Actinotalea lenta TaxID=3064654 RepID=UPI002713833B|nr:P22 phage major capsid protein family protein [Isoptericola sp. b490]MDO8120640.1 P22 phage major capsid protein family protein [Isoptericola sp. b490]